MTIKPFFAWYDLWIGGYYDRKKRVWYVLLLPMLGFKITLATRCVRCREAVEQWDEGDAHVYDEVVCLPCKHAEREADRRIDRLVWGADL